MKYNRNQWLYTAIEEGNEVKLQAFEKRLEGISLIDALDWKSIKLLAKLSREKLENLEKSFPKILEKIPFQEALLNGNLYLLEVNRELYFQGDWEKVVEKIFFLNYKRAVNVSEFIKEWRKNAKLVAGLEWIQGQQGKLPVIEGALEICSKAILWKYRKRINLLLKPEDENEFELFIKQIRQLIGENRFFLGDLSESSIEEIEEIQWEEYESVMIEISVEAAEHWSSENLGKLFQRCPLEKIEIQNPKCLEKKNFLELVLSEIEEQEILQKGVCQLYDKYCGVEVLYNAIQESLIYTGAYKGILDFYYQKAEEQDEIIGGEEDEDI